MTHKERNAIIHAVLCDVGHALLKNEFKGGRLVLDFDENTMVDASMVTAENFKTRPDGKALILVERSSWSFTVSSKREGEVTLEVEA